NPHLNMTLRDANGRVLAHPAKTAHTTKDQFIIRSLEAGTYYIGLEGMHSRGQRYTIKIAADDIQPATRVRAETWDAETIRLRWQDNATDELAYRIDGYNPETGAWDKLAITGRNSTAISVKSLNIDTRYGLRLSAISRSPGGTW